MKRQEKVICRASSDTGSYLLSVGFPLGALLGGLMTSQGIVELWHQKTGSTRDYI